MTLSSRHSDHKQNGYDSSAETTLGDYEGKNNDDSSTEHSINLLPTTPKKVNSSNAKRNIGKTNEVHESKLSTSMKSPLSMPPVLNRNLVTEKPILTVSKILSPATETLNELSSIDAASASNLRFDFSQLSQLTYEETDTAKNNDNVISLEVNKTNNDNNVASSNDGETKRSSFHILDKTSATMTSTIKEKTPINTSMKQDHLHSFSNNSPKSKCDKNEIDKATELRMKKIQASVNYKKQQIYLGMYNKVEAIEKKTLAREKIIEWTKGIDEIKHPSVSWVKDEFERLNIRRVDRIKVSKPGDTKLEKCMVNYHGRGIYLGQFSAEECEVKITEAKKFIEEVCLKQDTKPTIDRMRQELERANIRVVTKRNSKSNNENREVIRFDIDGNDCRDHSSNVNKTPQDQDSKVLKRDSTTFTDLGGVENIRLSKKIRIEDDTVLRLVRLPEEGSLGMFIVDQDKGSDACIVQELRENGQAVRHGVKVNDELFQVPGNVCSDDDMATVDHNNLKGLSTEKIKLQSLSGKRPISFLVRRRSNFVEDKGIHVDTKNSEESITKLSISEAEITLALREEKFPNVPCCKKCNCKTKGVRFHHYLCPKHHDFEDSGARDKLKLLLAGIRDKCESCQYEFQHGKKCLSKTHTSKCIGSTSLNQNLEKTLQHRQKSVSVSHPNLDIKKQPKKDINVIHAAPVTPNVDSDSRGSYIFKETKTLQLTNDVKPTWVSCPNPWGNFDYTDGDFVLMSPACYDLAFTYRKSSPHRFVSNPFEYGSEYFQTHISPQERCRVLQLTRDRLALRSWGFEFCYHDFGGACLVTNIEPLSPAEAAVDIGSSRVSNNTEQPFSGLKTNDMILCINGKQVGGMTELELAVELDICGQDVIIIVAPCRLPNNHKDNPQTNKWSSVDPSKSLQWCDIGNSPAYSTKDDMTSDFEKKEDLFLSRFSGVSISKTCSYDTQNVDRSRKSSTHAMLTKDISPKPGNRSISSNENNQDDWSNDENPWLGCICGETHEKPESVFWIQCDSCDAWYNCAPKCIGFSEDEAQQKDDWQCPECLQSNEVSPTKTHRELDQSDLNINVTPNQKDINKIQNDSNNCFSVGTVVEIEDRTWVGSNKPGGVAKIIASRKKDGELFYDVHYILESRKEFNIEAEFIKFNENVSPGFSSPANGTRLSRSRGRTGV